MRAAGDLQGRLNNTPANKITFFNMKTPLIYIYINNIKEIVKAINSDRTL